VLRVRGTVLPATGESVTLRGEGPDGQELVGETAVSLGGPPRRVWLEPQEPRALPEALAAIRTADIVLVGPGSLYTSLIPSLLVPALREALVGSQARKVYIANLVTQPGETNGFDLDHHLAELGAYAPGFRPDVVLLNSAPLPTTLQSLYAATGAEAVRAPASWHGPGVLLQRHLLAVTPAGTVRHHPELLASVLRELLGAQDSGSGVRGPGSGPPTLG
jgi:uncharacterized cofD-like protein